MAEIFHIVPRVEWEALAAGDLYRPASLESEGFIHCSTREQVIGTANGIFRGQHGLLLLTIDSERVVPEIISEDCYESGQAFPHIYGPLDQTAVVRVVPFPCDKDGLFNSHAF